MSESLSPRCLAMKRARVLAVIAIAALALLVGGYISPTVLGVILLLISAIVYLVFRLLSQKCN
jgi:hypothetical protein